jgi:hypothetical protein
MRKDIAFRAEDGTLLRGWHYRPAGDGPFPAIVMAHGFSATKEMYLDDFAAAFAAAGFVVLVYDNRNLGASDGAPRGHIDPRQQVDDYRDAITYVVTLDEVDAGRIGIWGSSYSGGHVLEVAAIDRRVRCVVSQVPLVSGLENARRLIRADHWAALRAAFNADRAARLRGEPPQMLPVVGEHEGDPCALPTADSREFFRHIVAERDTGWENAVTLRSVELFTEYEPGRRIGAISPTPLLMVLARDDHLTPFDLAAAAFAKAREPKQLLVVPGGHFDAYVGDNFRRSIEVQRDWFARHLAAGAAVAATARVA